MFRKLASLIAIFAILSGCAGFIDIENAGPSMAKSIPLGANSAAVFSNHKCIFTESPEDGAESVGIAAAILSPIVRSVVSTSIDYVGSTLKRASEDKRKTKSASTSVHFQTIGADFAGEGSRNSNIVINPSIECLLFVVDGDGSDDYFDIQELDRSIIERKIGRPYEGNQPISEILNDANYRTIGQKLKEIEIGSAPSFLYEVRIVRSADQSAIRFVPIVLHYGKSMLDVERGEKTNISLSISLYDPEASGLGKSVGSTVASFPTLEIGKTVWFESTFRPKEAKRHFSSSPWINSPTALTRDTQIVGQIQKRIDDLRETRKLAIARIAIGLADPSIEPGAHFHVDDIQSEMAVLIEDRRDVAAELALEAGLQDQERRGLEYQIEDLIAGNREELNRARVNLRRHLAERDVDASVDQLRTQVQQFDKRISAFAEAIVLIRNYDSLFDKLENDRRSVQELRPMNIAMTVAEVAKAKDFVKFLSSVFEGAQKDFKTAATGALDPVKVLERREAEKEARAKAQIDREEKQFTARIQALDSAAAADLARFSIEDDASISNDQLVQKQLASDKATLKAKRDCGIADSLGVAPPTCTLYLD